MRELLKENTIDGVFCGDDNLAMGAMDACREAGLSVPADVGIIGFNDMAIAGWPAYNLTTVHQPTAQIITSAVELVLSIIEKPVKKPIVRLFDCKLVTRGS